MIRLTGVMMGILCAQIAVAGCIQGNCYNGKGTFQFKSGSFYKGEFQSGRITGFGTLKYRNGDVYTGQWLNQIRSGEGFMRYSNGDKYQGQWKDNLYHGYGTLSKSNGNVLEGIWKNGNFAERPLKEESTANTSTIYSPVDAFSSRDKRMRDCKLGLLRRRPGALPIHGRLHL